MGGAQRTLKAGPWILVGFATMGLVLAIWQPVALSVLLEWGRWLTAHPAMIAVLVLAMVVMFTFALPASAFVWLVAPFHPPVVAVLILLTGSVLGAISAYFLARHLGRDWEMGPNARKVTAFLSRRSDLATQCALRILPGFPHSVVNYAGGMLRLPLVGFALAAVIGLGIKWGVYATAIHRGVGALERGEVVDAWDVLPLVILAFLLLLGAWARRRLERQQTDTHMD